MYCWGWSYLTHIQQPKVPCIILGTSNYLFTGFPACLLTNTTLTNGQCFLTNKEATILALQVHSLVVYLLQLRFSLPPPHSHKCLKMFKV